MFSVQCNNFKLGIDKIKIQNKNHKSYVVG